MSRLGSRKKEAMKQIENGHRKANDRRSGSRGSNIRLPEWNKTERNTPGVSSPLPDNQALATIKTERPFRFPLTNAHRNEKYTEPIRSNPDLHTERFVFPDLEKTPQARLLAALAPPEIFSLRVLSTAPAEIMPSAL
jgi:hypothetical protein